MTRPIRSARRTCSPLRQRGQGAQPRRLHRLQLSARYASAITEQARIAGFNPKVFYTGVGTAFPLLQAEVRRQHRGRDGHRRLERRQPGDQGLPGAPQGSAANGAEPDRWASPVTYASLQMLQQAIERVGKIDREAVIKDMQTGDLRHRHRQGQAARTTCRRTTGGSASGRAASSTASRPATNEGAADPDRSEAGMEVRRVASRTRKIAVRHAPPSQPVTAE